MSQSFAYLPGEFRDDGSPSLVLSAHRQRLERCLAEECDIDPMILRARMLRQRGALSQARCLEEELLPLF